MHSSLHVLLYIFGVALFAVGVCHRVVRDENNGGVEVRETFDVDPKNMCGDGSKSHHVHGTQSVPQHASGRHHRRFERSGVGGTDTVPNSPRIDGKHTALAPLFFRHTGDGNEHHTW